MATAKATHAEEESDVVFLSTPHWFADCQCGNFARVVRVTHPIRADIRVTSCMDIYGRRPIRDALDVLSDYTGMSFVDRNEAGVIVSTYSTASEYEILKECEAVCHGGYNRTYYLRRDVLKTCISSKRPKCVACGIRSCRDPDHRIISDDLYVLDKMSSGDVYLLLHEATQYVKVGFSSQPAKRLRSHTSAIPGRLRVLGVFPGGRWLERAIHEDLSEWLVPGYREWFFYSPSVKEYLSRIASARKTYQADTQKTVKEVKRVQ